MRLLVVHYGKIQHRFARRSTGLQAIRANILLLLFLKNCDILVHTKIYEAITCDCICKRVGANDDEVPPVPIPNTEVKLIGAEDTWRVAAWENRSVPTHLCL